LASVSHELRSPLNAILGLADLMLDSSLDAGQREHVATIKQAGDSLLAIVDGMLDMAKLEAGRLELLRDDVDVRQLVGEIVRTFAVRAEARGTDLVIDVREAVPDLLRVDGLRLRQVLTNLVANAVKFTDAGEVVVTVDVDRDRLVFAVRDTGIGIEATAIQRIFDPFWQADASTSHRFGGTGLGLSICKRIVELWSGRIAVHSEPGIGSTFSFDVPFDEALVKPRRPLPTGTRALVVLAQPAQGAAVARRLEAWGCSVEVMTPAAAARYPFAERAKFDLVVASDPSVDWRAATAVAAEGRAPVVLLLTPSLLAQGLDRVEAQRLAGFMMWPCAPHELRQEVEVALGVADRVAGAPGASQPRPDEACARVLIAEDSPLNQRVIAAALRRAGHEFVIADNGADCVDAFRRDRFDVVLMDLQMPGLSGVEAARWIRGIEREDGGRTPIYALTASSGDEDRRLCEAAGMDGFLSKPLSPSRLLELVRRHARSPSPKR
jgi:CheY-like chemotaxis protein